VIGIVSLALRRPFTLQYAREMASDEAMQRPDFLTVNYVITAVWTLAFLLMISANLLLITLPDLPLWSGLAMAFLIRNPAVYFSKWYPDYQLRKYQTASAISATAQAR
jgi:tryptophan-rich sensory protein